MEIIRGRLSTKDFSPQSLRYNSDCDCVQYTPDGGATWVDDPSDDPRTSPKFLKPLKTGSDIRCRSAASMVKWLRDFIEYEAGILTAGAEVVAVSNAAFALFDIIAPWAVLVQLLIDVAGTLFGIGGAALTAAFDEDVWDTLLCILFCHIGADGLVSDEQLIDIQALISADINTTAALVLNLIISTQGFIGLTNAGTLYEVGDEDCVACDCGWCFIEDLTLTDGGYATLLGQARGEWISGTGWRFQVFEGTPLLQILKSFDVSTITAIVVTVDVAGINANAIELPNGTQIVSSTCDGIGCEVGTEGLFTAGSVFLNFQSSCTVKSIRWQGLGACPFGEPNC